MDSTLADRTLMEWRDSYIYYMMTVIYIYSAVFRLSYCNCNSIYVLTVLIYYADIESKHQSDRSTVQILYSITDRTVLLSAPLYY